MKKARTIALYCLAILFLLMISLWLLRFQIAVMVFSGQLDKFRTQYLSRSPEAELKLNLSKIQNDAAVLAKFPIFNKGSMGNSDAAPFLNPLISSEPPGAKAGKLTLDKEILEELNSKKKFEEIKIDWNKYPLDFSWLSELSKFDFWAWDQSAPFISPENALILEIPLPNYGELLNWTKLRLLYGRDRGQLAEAIKEVENLAALIMTHENLIGAVTSISMIQITVNLYPFLKPAEKSKMNYLGWTEDTKKQARRFFWAQAAFLDLRLSEDLFEKLSTIKIGICQRAQEGLTQNISLRKLLREPFTREYLRLDQFQRSTAQLCRPSFVRKAWMTSEYQGLFKPHQDIFHPVMNSLAQDSNENGFLNGKLTLGTVEDLEKHPQLGRAIAYIIMSIGEPNWLNQYKTNE